jgi:outer membrane protein, multidrug efflux system
MIRSISAISAGLLALSSTACLRGGAPESSLKSPGGPKFFVAEVPLPGAAQPPAEFAHTGVESGSTSRATENHEVWWAAFADPALDGVIQEAMRNNYFIRDVRTLISENMLDPTLPQGWWWPLQVGIPAGTPAGVAYNSVGIAGKNGGTHLDYASANIGITASYQVDLWGNLAARRAAGTEFAEQQRQSTEIASQNIAEQVAQLWFDILVERAFKELIEREVKLNQELFNLVKARFEQHLTPRLVVLQQEQQLLNIQAQLPLIAARISILNSQLTALLGRTPSPYDGLVPADRKLPDLPPSPNLGTPSDLNQTTPEMRFARLRVTEIEQRVKQNDSAWLPTVEVVGSAGIVSFDFHEPKRENLIGVRLSWPIFDGGRHHAESKLLDLTLKRRKWQYDLALKTQIGRVQDALLQEKSQAESLRSLRSQIELGGRVLDEAKRLFEQGQSDYLPVISALSNLAALERDGLRAQRLLLTYRVQLYRALGGTWSYAVTELP